MNESDDNTAPIFVSGRQHSGNTLMSVLLGRLPGVYAQVDESTLFETHEIIDREQCPDRRATLLAEVIALEREDLRPWLAEHIRESIREHPKDPCVTHYLNAMDAATAKMGCHRWAQKGTSYIFYAQEILDRVPHSKFLYLLRNPWDLVASRRVRNKGYEAVMSTMLGWSKGVQIADRMVNKHPDRFRIVRYESLVRESEPVIQDLCEWIGEPYSANLLDVPHVNPSENKYALESEQRGLNESRIFQYKNRVPKQDIAATDLLVERYGLTPFIETHYQDLPHVVGDHDATTLRKARAQLRWAPFRYAWFYLTIIKRKPSHLIKRTLQRIRS